MDIAQTPRSAKRYFPSFGSRAILATNPPKSYQFSMQIDRIELRTFL
jgi:hypothetical protein